MRDWLSRHAAVLIVGAYVLGAVITFGHAYNHYDRTLDLTGGIFPAAVPAIAAGATWPLYWATWVMP